MCMYKDKEKSVTYGVLEPREREVPGRVYRGGDTSVGTKVIIVTSPKIGLILVPRKSVRDKIVKVLKLLHP